MSIATFVRDAGERIVANAKAAFQMHPGDEEEASPQKTPGAPQKKAGSGATDKSAGDAIADYIRAQNLEVENLKVTFDAPTSTVHVSGTAKDQATKEKVVLCCGNIAGVEKVDEQLGVKEAATPAQFHTVAKGDTLSAIAKKVYGDANKYRTIFEANKPMLKDPDKIYPGQTLRIPPLN
jgi:nucleoid-associated protein YgaU